MTLMLGGWPARRRLEYAAFLVGLTRPARVFHRGPLREVTIVIPDSLGDVAINASVARYYKAHHPEARITLITHPRYTAAGEFVQDYDKVLGYGSPLADLPVGQLTYRQQVAMARDLTPTMDRLFLAQPSAWCDAVSARYTMIEMQNRLCKVPHGIRHLPRLSLPPQAGERAGEIHKRHAGPAVFIASGAYTILFGEAAQRYCQRLVEWCVSQGIHVYWNDTAPLVEHPLCTAVGGEALAVAVALAARSDAVISMRSGFSDLVGFVRPDVPHLVLYPPGNYPYSRLSWLDWCSLREMGVIGAVEQVHALDSLGEADDLLAQTADWLQALLPPPA